MSEQIECVGGPLDGQKWIDSGPEFELPRRDRAVLDVTPFPYIGSLHLSGIHEKATTSTATTHHNQSTYIRGWNSEWNS